MKYFIGVDPGKTGAMAIIDQDEKVIEWMDYPQDIPELVKSFTAIINSIKNEGASHYDMHACVEKVWARPGEGVTSCFNFGQNYAAWQCMLSVHSIPYMFVTSHKWQKVMFDSSKKEDTKKKSLNLARRLFPSVELNRKKHHGRADALHLARYARYAHNVGLGEKPKVEETKTEVTWEKSPMEGENK